MDEFLNKLNSDKIDYHHAFLDDLVYLLNNDLRGSKKQFVKQFNRQMVFIDEYPIDYLYQYDSNEILKNIEGFTLYSLHLKGETFNVRFLATPFESKLLLLVAFNERSGKAKTGYNTHIPKALERLKEMEVHNHD